MSSKNEIQEEVIYRNIKLLWHFTRLENIESIFKKGLIPRNKFTKNSILPIINDNDRHNGYLNATNISISFPNYKLFYHYRCHDQISEWALIALKVDLLWEKECIFCIENAANHYIRNETPEQKTGIYGFRRIFAENEYWPSRKDLNIPPSYPTNPQAEVLVFDEIEPHYLIGALLNSEPNKLYCEKKLLDISSLSTNIISIQEKTICIGVQAKLYRKYIFWINRIILWQIDLSLLLKMIRKILY